MRPTRVDVLATVWLLAGACCGTVLVASLPGALVGVLGVVLAIGLAVLTMAYAIG